ncbi:MAG: hypothetical protein P4M08_01765 [Oligoflexia bacterium]|nr:hypothetical protein [Oligoflexia bacterium]
MKHNTNQYYAYRIRLEKLKQKTWRLVVLSKFLLLLALLVTHYLER